MKTTVSGQPSSALTMMDARPPRSRSRWLLALDSAGRIVWYYELPPEIPPGPPNGNAIELTRRSNGNFVYLAGYFGIDEISPDGRLAHRFRSDDPPASRAHHDLTELSDGRLLFLGAEDRPVDDSANGGANDLLLRGDTLHLLDLETGQEEVVWRAFDALSPTQANKDYADEEIEGVRDWTHANSVEVGPRGNVVLSLRNLNQVISLASDLHTIEWKLGGFDSSFSFPQPDDVFFGQHAASELPGDRILLFDNGKYRHGKDYSRALELQLDRQNMTARKVWEYAPRPSVYADIVGNAVRMANGHTLVSFGFREAPDDPVLTVEADAGQNAAWTLAVSWQGSRTSSYRSYPLDSLGGEQPIAAPD